MTEIVAPFQQFFDTSGRPLANGAIYIGTANLDAQSNPIAVYWDEALTIPAAQPIRTLNGYPVLNGAPARLYANVADYSITVRNAQNRLMYSANVTNANLLSNFQATLAGPTGSSLVGFNNGGVGSVTRTAEAKMRDVVSVKDFGAVGNGAVNEQPAIQAAINAIQANGGGTLSFPTGNYRIDSGLIVTGNNITLRGDGYLSSVIFSNTNGFQLLKFQNSSRSGIEHLGVYRNVFTTTATDYTLWLENCVQFSGRRVLMQGSYYNMVISGTASADFTFQECIWNFATGPAMIYMVRSGAGLNGAYHFYRCLLNQDYPATAPVPANYIGARADTTVYAAKDVITVGGFYYQCVTAGTSAASQPADYGAVWYLTNITDGTAVFWLMAPVTYFSARVDTGLSYVNFRECDFTSCTTFGLQTLNSLAGDKPQSIHVEQCTFHGNIFGGIHILSGQEIDIKSVEVLVPTGPGTQYGLLFNTNSNNVNVTTSDVHAVLGDAVYIGGPGINVSASDITGNTLGIRVAANINRSRIIGNDLGSSPRWGANVNAVTVTAGTSDSYVISQNVIAGATVGITDGGTGVSKSVTANV